MPPKGSSTQFWDTKTHWAKVTELSVSVVYYLTKQSSPSPKAPSCLLLIDGENFPQDIFIESSLHASTTIFGNNYLWMILLLSELAMSKHKRSTQPKYRNYSHHVSRELRAFCGSDFKSYFLKKPRGVNSMKFVIFPVYGAPS